MYRLLWHDSYGDLFGEKRFATVRAAHAAALKIQNAYVQRAAPGFDIVWGGSGRVIPLWYRQMCLRIGG